MAAALIVFVRAPSPDPGATARAVEAARTVAKRAGAELVVQYTPDDAEPQLRPLLGDDAEYRAQCRGGYGDRLEAAMVDAMVAGASSVVVVLDPAIASETVIGQALATLERSDVSLLPDAAGGYSLIAVREPHPELFERIPWNTDGVLATTIANASGAGLKLELLPG